ncbi:MAG: hypothetical protein Kow0077_29820 [Anaerolineae bacterium]
MDAHKPTTRQFRPTIRRAACRGCKRCLGARACPEAAIEDTPKGQPPRVHLERCTGCLACMDACPVGGLVLVELAEDS